MYYYLTSRDQFTLIDIDTDGRIIKHIIKAPGHPGIYWRNALKDICDAAYWGTNQAGVCLSDWIPHIDAAIITTSDRLLPFVHFQTHHPELLI